MSKTVKLLPVLLFLSLSISAQDTELMQAEEQIKSHLRTPDITGLEDIQRSLESKNEDDSLNYLRLYYQAMCSWHINIKLMEADPTNGKKNVEKGIDYVSQSIQHNPNFSDAYALRSILNQQMLYYDKTSINTLQPVIEEDFKKSQELNPDNPRLYMAMGFFYYHTPEVYGGGLEKAKESFSQAIKLFTNSKATTSMHPSWGEDQAYIWLGKVAELQDSVALAKSYYKKTLDIDPNHAWARQLLQATDNKRDDGPFQLNFMLFILGAIVFVVIVFVVFRIYRQKINSI